MDAEHYSSNAQVKFKRLFRFYNHGSRLIEKTPHNIARVGFLETLSINPLYIHIVRNGLDVAQSINRIATNNSYKMAGRSRSNQWWGMDECKWHTLAQEGSARGYFPDEVNLIQTHRQRGAYEWLVSLGESDGWRSRLGHRFYELTYTEFTSAPAKSLEQLCEFLQISCPKDWLNNVVPKVHPENHYGEPSLRLPPAMCERFNAYQSHYAFDGYAIPVSV
jgi:hypothetical protein